MKITENRIEECSIKLNELYACRNKLMFELEEIEYDAKHKTIVSYNKKIDDLSNEIEDYIENVYSKVVFEIYSLEKPDLLRIRTGEKVSWDAAFGDDYEKISKSLRHSLVGLVEEPGRYKFLDQ